MSISGKQVIIIGRHARLLGRTIIIKEYTKIIYSEIGQSSPIVQAVSSYHLRQKAKVQQDWSSA